MREYFSTCHILHCRKIAPLVFVRQVCDVGPELAVRNIRSEGAIQDIWCCAVFLSGFLYGLVRILLSDDREEMIFLHEPEHFFMVHSFASLSELHSNDPISVLSMVFPYDRFDSDHIFLLTFISGGSHENALFPCVVSRERYPGDIAEHSDGMFGRKVFQCLPCFISGKL